MTDTSQELELVTHAERLLEQATTIPEVMDVRNIAEGVRLALRQAGAGRGAVNHATVVILRAERKVADFVDAGQDTGDVAGIGRPQKDPESGSFSLADLGLRPQRVHEARTIRDRYTDSDLVKLGKAATERGQYLARDAIVRKTGWAEREQAQGRYADTAGLAHADVLLVDPPWRYDVQISDARAIENQYPTMTYEELAALELPAGPEAVLFCWTTSPQCDVAVALVQDWGFRYRSQLVWVKDKIGMGYYARARHELLFIATRGNPKIPAPADRPDSVVEAPRGKHSEKPAIVYDLIEAMYPQATKRELFARHRRPGWLEPWGLDTPSEAAGHD